LREVKFHLRWSKGRFSPASKIEFIIKVTTDERSEAFPGGGRGTARRGSPKMLAFLGVRGWRWMRSLRNNSASLPTEALTPDINDTHITPSHTLGKGYIYSTKSLLL
jgi:hypothetical protein